MGDESDEDYMSDALLQKCTDVRPGLVSEEVKRKHKLEAEHKEKNIISKVKPLKEQEAERRNEGLQQAIGEDNKGFALLQKMGFKPGMALGKHGTGRKEPVPVDFKNCRGGLGEASERKRKTEIAKEQYEQIKKNKIVHEKQQMRDYRSQMSSQHFAKQVHNDLLKSQKVCEQLDTDSKSLTEPLQTFFWPHYMLKNDESEETFEDDDCYEEEDFDETEQLKLLTTYLRETYFYCIWCGNAYNDLNDLEQNCPGSTCEDHD